MVYRAKSHIIDIQPHGFYPIKGVFQPKCINSLPKPKHTVQIIIACNYLPITINDQLSPINLQCLRTEMLLEASTSLLSSEVLNRTVIFFFKPLKFHFESPDLFIQIRLYF